jgi:DDE domain
VWPAAVARSHQVRAVARFAGHSPGRRDGDAARRFFQQALTTSKVTPVEVISDAAPGYPRALDELIPSAWHTTSNGMPTTGSKPTTVASNTDSDRCEGYAPTALPPSSSGLAFMRNRRGHYEFAPRLRASCESLRRSPNSPKHSDNELDTASPCPSIRECNTPAAFMSIGRSSDWMPEGR